LTMAHFRWLVGLDHTRLVIIYVQQCVEGPNRLPESRRRLERLEPERPARRLEKLRNEVFLKPKADAAQRVIFRVGGGGVAMQNPLVSIVITAYATRPDYLSTAIQSALGQTWGNLEVIVSDDSPDQSLRVLVEQFADPRVRYRHNS